MSATTQRPPARREKPAATNIKTCVFESAGPRKYAIQIQKASNGNPCVRLVEGVPQPDGTYRKFNLTIWSEDFQAFFNALDEMRNYIRDNAITTPPGHKYEPNRERKGRPRAA